MRGLWFAIASAAAFLAAPSGAAGGDGSLGIGANGEITRLQGNQLVRTRQAYAARGFAGGWDDGGGGPHRADTSRRAPG
jgi:hypothetical protein